MAFKGRFDNRDDVTVEKYICSGNPVMLKVSPCATQNQTTCPHFVVATGKTVLDQYHLTWTINDPGFPRTDLGPYKNAYYGYRLFTGPKGGPASERPELVASAVAPDQSRLIISAHPFVQLTVTDPSGRKSQCGVPVGTGSAGIPGATCGTEAIQNDFSLDYEDTTPPTSIFEAPTPASGAYAVDVSSVDPAGFTGDLTVEVFAYDSTGVVSTARATGGTTPGATTRYTVSYEAAVGTPVRLTGGGDSPGGGPRKGGCSTGGAASEPLLMILALALQALERKILLRRRRGSGEARRS